MKNHHSVIYDILKSANKILTIEDITKIIIENNLIIFGTKSSTPQHVVGTALKRRTINSNHTYTINKNLLFYRYDNFYFGLSEWLTEEEKKSYTITVEKNNELDSEYNPNADLLDTSLFLEKEWHQWLYKHISVNGLEALGFGKLRLFDEDKQSRFIGKYNTKEVGEIDLLLRNDKEIIVVELKRKGVDETVGQICRYVGWVETKLKKKNEKVYGIIIAQDIDKKLEYAIKPIKEHVFYQQLEMNISFGKNSKIIKQGI
ncbi:MAG: hypothetical protein DRG78_00650 [Epsilonproteobacteria bacterium]|nr:MAG: hypothetical protein DRG78_00650 [Campylobacterota bacterium]